MAYLRRLVLLLVIALVAGACSIGPADTDEGGDATTGGGAAQREPSAPEALEDPDGGDAEPADDEREKRTKEERSKRRRNGRGDGGDVAAGDPDATDDGSPRTRPRPRQGNNSAPSGDGPPSTVRAEPRAGRYVFAQQGWEEFCAGGCNRDDLPATQRIEVGVMPLHGGTRVVTDARSSNNRSVRTGYYLTSRALDITRVELSYRGFSNTYDPSPPVRSLRFPLTPGDNWSGSWSADTSGDYSVNVLGRDGLVVDGKEIETFKIDTVTEFRGEFRGRMIATIWVDPETAMTVRSRGHVRLEAQFGRFASRFNTMLIEGPGY